MWDRIFLNILVAFTIGHAIFFLHLHFQKTAIDSEDLSMGFDDDDGDTFIDSTENSTLSRLEGTGFDTSLSIHFAGKSYPPSCVQSCRRLMVHTIDFLPKKSCESFDKVQVKLDVNGSTSTTALSGVECVMIRQPMDINYLTVPPRFAGKVLNSIIFPKAEVNVRRRPIQCASEIKGVCSMPLENQCDDSAISIWSISVSPIRSSNAKKKGNGDKGEQIDEKTLQEAMVSLDSNQTLLNITPQRPFQIKSVFHDKSQNMLFVVGFFFPHRKEPNDCNRMYCIFKDRNGNIHETIALSGDVSFAKCPIPNALKTTLTGATLYMTYDHKIFSLPFQILISSVETSIASVRMTICTIVKSEGQFLLPWIEYHMMMGYARFVLYDNNGSAKDTEMDDIIRKYPHNIIRIRWPFRHAQTEALTDCIHRYGNMTKWMSFIDVDEYLVPSAPYETVRSYLVEEQQSTPYLMSPWLVFGPCKEREGKMPMLMEICSSTSRLNRWVPKPTFQPRYAAGIQGFGPHAIRLAADQGVENSYSTEYTAPNLYVYHYRYGTWAQFLKKRVGETAGRTLVRSEKDVAKMWNHGKKHSTSLPSSKNRILHFLPKLRRRLAKL
eukprot:TRINITY_DN8780_c0_g1_i1.p1 TRINITY_DN8780_c0_g1~~TRINITY_DN8780_c0_g1_i1.p1  ORF type:complete len:607 (-),score=118.52 TRINITY_DN8780_c0_g1_i1:109-1929(-)